MKILIVESSGKKFTSDSGVSRFEFIIKETLVANKYLMDIETEFISRDMEDLDDLLYEQSSSYLRRESALFFDSIDLIFVSGDPSIIPWGKKIESLNVLLRMCIKTEKPVFASGVGFFSLVMLCATDIEKGYFNVLNGNGKGSKLEDISKEIRLRKVVEDQDVFLDSTTGDYYRFNYESKEWVPRGNMGIHSRVTSGPSQNMKSLVTGVPSFRPASQDTKSLYKNGKDECLVYLRKSHMNHWAVAGCPNRFIVRNSPIFEVHPFNFRNTEKVFEVLAEANTAPQIIHFSKGSILATQFLVDKAYKDTLVPLRNFITMKLDSMRRGEHAAMKITVVDNTWYERADFDERRFYDNQDNLIRHCGMTTVYRGLNYAENNAIKKQSHKAEIYDNRKRNKPMQFSAQTNLDLIARDNKNFNSDYKKNLKKGVFSMEKIKRIQSNGGSANSIRDQKPIGKAPKEIETHDSMPHFAFKHAGIMKKKFHGNVRLIKGEGFDYDDGWVPGYRSKAARIDPKIDDDKEPDVSNEMNRLLKDHMDKIRFGTQADGSPINPKKITFKLLDTSLNLVPTPVPAEGVQQNSNSVKKIETNPDPNEFVKKEVVVRRVGPQFFTKYHVHKKLDDDYKAGKFFYSQPYVPVKQVFR